MVLLDIFFLILTICGLLLFAYGLKINSSLSVFFGSLIALAPVSWLTFGVGFLPMIPVLALVIIYVLQKKGILEFSKYKTVVKDSSRGKSYE